MLHIVLSFVLRLLPRHPSGLDFIGAAQSGEVWLQVRGGTGSPCRANRGMSHQNRTISWIRKYSIGALMSIQETWPSPLPKHGNAEESGAGQEAACCGAGEAVLRFPDKPGICCPACGCAMKFLHALRPRARPRRSMALRHGKPVRTPVTCSNPLPGPAVAAPVVPATGPPARETIP